MNRLSGLTNPTINNNNCQVITTTLSNNRISELRKKNISVNLEVNYGFDVTPARLITGLITERGICEANEKGILKLFPEH